MYNNIEDTTRYDDPPFQSEEERVETARKACNICIESWEELGHYLSYKIEMSDICHKSVCCDICQDNTNTVVYLDDLTD